MEMKVDTVVVICAWCPNSRERTLALVREGKEVSHGMCPACQALMEAQLADRA